MATKELSHQDFRSIGAQIADTIKKDSGKTVSWTGRIGAPSDNGMDWMEFSVLGKPEETLVARLGESGVTLRPIS